MADKLKIRAAAEALLGREGAAVAHPAVLSSYKGKRILVTGGGGSIGSELCRRLWCCEPQVLVIFDMYENCAFELLDELTVNGASERVFVEIGSVTDRKRLDDLFERYGFDTVFHAAAHKHVPLMEQCPHEAVRNNIFGTEAVFDSAQAHGCERVILISTDKAVEPESVMGATKRFSELSALSRRGEDTVFSAVRFGNVLGSAGSLLPLMMGRIERGEPISITDKRMTRYFMTPSEAAQLVLLAGASGERGALYILDMGEPVNIYDMLLRLIRFMGKEPFADIEIVETGIRPGEKLSERLYLGEVEIREADGRIFVRREEMITRECVFARLEELKASLEGDDEAGRAALKRAVPEYKY